VALNLLPQIQEFKTKINLFVEFWFWPAGGAAGRDPAGHTWHGFSARAGFDLTIPAALA
jgi:hypothetical protein